MLLGVELGHADGASDGCVVGSLVVVGSSVFTYEGSVLGIEVGL